MSKMLIGEHSLRAVFMHADATDQREGMLAYERYNSVIHAFASEFHHTPARIAAAFVSLSPNNDYLGNLRSLLTLCLGIREQRNFTMIKTSTYRHCLQRAYLYLTTELDFERETKGLKIINFYHNILRPSDHRYVTIDGHMCAIWRGQNLTMKQAIIRNNYYNTIASAVKRLAFSEFLLPNQFQATCWFARKRIMRIKYNPQLDLFAPPDDQWRTQRKLCEIKPYNDSV